MQPFTLLTIIAALTLSKAATIHRPPAGLLESNPHLSINDDAYFVTFKGEAGTDQAKSDHEVFRAAVKKLGIKVKERREFTQFINAISLEVAASQLGKISTIKAVKDVFPMIAHKPPRLIRKDVRNPALKFSHGITGVAEVHDTLGYFGKGVKVGVVDSGIDFKHPALGECFGKGCKVAYGYDFVGDAYDGTNTPVPGGEPRDHCNGHGTHVAGIIGAKDKDFVGVAPEVTLGAYRVFGCEGSTSTDIIIAAMERAFMDGMDVINLSLGGGSSWSGYPDAVVADKLAEKGVLVVAAMGNDGDKGLWQAGSPAMAVNGIAVASYDNTRYMSYGFHVDGQEAKVFDYQPSDEKTAFKLEHIDVVSAKGEDGDDLACKPLPADSLKGKLALVRRGDCNFNDKAKIVQNAGAVAAIIYNKEVGAMTPSITDPEIKIPIAGIKQESGNKLVELLAKSPVKVTFGKEKVVFDNPTGGRVSDFSSWGPGPELEMKPDLGAPGGLIYSTYPLDMGGYATLSGTSMATPYMAGAAALYIQAKGKRPPTEIRDTFQINAKQTTNLGTDDLSAVSSQGAGLINVRDTIESETFLTPASIKLMSSDVKAGKAHKITVENTGDINLRYELTHKPAVAVKAWDADGELSSKPEQKAASAKVKIETPKFTLKPGETRDVTVYFEEPKNLSLEEKWLYGGFIVVTPRLPTKQENAGKVKRPTPLSIPYGGFRGNYMKVPILSRKGFPVMYDAENNSTMQEGRKFSLKDVDKPLMLLRALHPCKSLQFRIVDQKDKDLGYMAGGDNKFTSRNDATPENSYFQVQWDGNVFSDGGSDSNASPAPDGTYKFLVKAQRPLSKGFDEWVGPEFTIDRSLNSTSTNSTFALDKKISRWARDRIPDKRHGIESSLLDNSVLPKPIKFVKKTQ